MSTLAVATVESKADETPPVFKDLNGSREIVQGVWVWCNMNGTGTIAINDDFNVASLTDEATGEYTFNFATALPNANYSVVSDTFNAARNSEIDATPTTSSVRIQAYSGFGETARDAEIVCIIICGNP